MRKTQCTALVTAVLAMSRCEAQQYWSAKNPVAPLPRSPFPELAVYEVEKGVYVYDDSQVDYEKLFQENTAEALAQNGGAMAMAIRNHPAPTTTFGAGMPWSNPQTTRRRLS